MRHAPGDVAGEQRQRQLGDQRGEQRLVLHQGRRHVLAYRDVAQELDRAHGLFARAPYERSAYAYPQRGAVLADVTLLDIEVPNLPAPETLEAHGGGLEVVAQSEACDRAAAQLLGAEAQHRAERPVAIAIGAVAAREGNADRRLLDGIAEQRVEGVERRKIAGRLERIRVVENRVQGRAFGALHRHARRPEPVGNRRFDGALMGLLPRTRRSDSGP